MTERFSVLTRQNSTKLEVNVAKLSLQDKFVLEY